MTPNSFSPSILQIIDVVKGNKPFLDNQLILEALRESDANYELLLKLGLAAANSNKIPQAIQIFHALQDQTKKDIRVLFNLGLCYSIIQNHPESLKSYDLALEIDKNDIQTLINKSATLIDMGEYMSAKNVLESAVQLSPENADAWLNLGLVLNKLMLYEDSIGSYEKALKVDPKLYVAWSNRCLPLQSLDMLDEAINSADQALKINPEFADAWYNKGIAFNELKQYKDAVHCFDKAIELRPGYAEAFLGKGNALDASDRHEHALECFDLAIEAQLDYIEAFNGKGIALHALNRHDDAIRLFDKALALQPEYAEAWSNKAATLSAQKQYEKALAHYDTAIKLRPGYADAWYNKGTTLMLLKQYELALAHYDKAIQHKPNYAEALYSKGVAYGELKQYQEAIQQYDMAINLNPDYSEAWHNKGFINAELKQYERALSFYEKAIDLRPSFALAWYNKGMALSDLKRHQDALVCYKKAFENDPDIDWLPGQMLHTKMLLCDWSDFEQEQAILKKLIFDGKKAAQPFTTHSLFDSLSLHQKSAIAFGLDRHPENNALGSSFLNKKQKKIKLAYFSADFRNHPVAYLLAEFFELHDRNNFEISAFYYGPPDNGEMHNRVMNAFDRFVEVRTKSDKEIAQLSRSLEIDIAIDLGGFTQLSRPGIFSYRAAPIQASYIGYLGTTGLSYIDYLIADPIIIPKENIRFYSEKIIYLPSYQVNDRNRRIGEKMFTRSELGLADDAFVFCCFNNHYKVTPIIFDGWMRILKSVDKSVLYLYAEGDIVKSNLIREASNRGVDAARLIFGGPIERADYLARYQVADLFLDTTPYNAGTTASDALWAGVPVLTLIGESFSSRVAASILSAVGLSELIVSTLKDYERLAIELATNPIKLEKIKSALVENRNSAPLFDTPLFTRNIEKAYQIAYASYHAGSKPKHIFV